jgi:16S rRNA (adenine1518-N6/adenine1519-N6)-dimethyltransferase
MKLSDIRDILSERDLQLTKSLGQNFLHDQNQVRRIVAAAEVTPDDKILEIGPGLGPLTEVLLEQGAQVLAIEKDERLFDFMRQKFAGNARLELMHDDALSYVKQHRAWAGWKLVSNLPYSVASPILVELSQAENPPDRMVTTLQIEVAQRIDAAADTEHYGILSLLLQLVFQPQGWFKIPASCFFPVPDVDSACITLKRRPALLLPPELQRVFTRIVKRGFSQRRKMMLKLLKQDWPADHLATAFEKLNLSLQIRAEAVSLPQFVGLTEMLAASKKPL